MWMFVWWAVYWSSNFCPFCVFLLWCVPLQVYRGRRTSHPGWLCWCRVVVVENIVVVLVAVANVAVVIVGHLTALYIYISARIHHPHDAVGGMMTSVAWEWWLFTIWWHQHTLWWDFRAVAALKRSRDISRSNVCARTTTNPFWNCASVWRWGFWICGIKYTCEMHQYIYDAIYPVLGSCGRIVNIENLVKGLAICSSCDDLVWKGYLICT